jgi:soluble lytic murein transglycosylase-like protein
MALPRTYDALFSKYAGRLPVNLMRALSKRESNLNPNEANDPAWGLMQVVSSVRTGYNSRYGTSYSKQDLLNPDVNVKIAAELLNRIASGYERFHPGVPNMRADWGNPEFVKLVIAGWNSGYSEAAGVGKVAKWLHSNGKPVTHDNVFKYASQAGGTKHLQNASKQNWQRSVVDLYFAEGGPGSTLRNVLVTLAVVGVLYKLMT